MFLLLVAGAAEGVKDKILFHYEKSIFYTWDNTFWNPLEMWKNKYTDRDESKGESFRGKYFTFTTDGMHLMKFIERWSIYFGVFFIVISWKFDYLVLSLFCAFVARSITFNLVWNLTTVKRKK